MQPPRFEFYDPHSPIYTSPRFLPPAKIVSCKVSDAIISHGAYLEECVVENAIVGLRSRIGKGVTIRVTLLAAVEAEQLECGSNGSASTHLPSMTRACCCATLDQLSHAILAG